MKINSAFSSWEELIEGVLQGSVLGTLLFNVYLNDLSEYTEVCNFADDTTFYNCNKDFSSRINRLELDSLLAIEWLENSHMKLNQEKCHLVKNTKIFGQRLNKLKSGKVGNKNY